MTEQRPYLNLGCGRVILPGPRPLHHALVNEAIYDYPLYVNIDRNPEPGVDMCFDLFTYPWPLETSSFDGALLTHIVEHISHDIRVNIIPPYDWDGNFNWHERVAELERCQDGWYAFFAELWRVLTPGARAYILSPYGWSQGAGVDPTHTRLIFEQTFTHSMQPDPNSPFKYETGGLNLKLVEGSTMFGLTPLFAHLADQPERMRFALQTQLNVAYELCVTLEAVKDESDHRQHAVPERTTVGGRTSGGNPHQGMARSARGVVSTGAEHQDSYAERHYPGSQ